MFTTGVTIHETVTGLKGELSRLLKWQLSDSLIAAVASIHGCGSRIREVGGDTHFQPVQEVLDRYGLTLETN